MIQLIVGLGNPDQKYNFTRHNIGFLLVNSLKKNYNLPDFKMKFQGSYTEGLIDNHKLYFLKPATYMNLSGISVQQFTNFFKIPPSNILVVHDDLDLPFGKAKIKLGGGNGGHKGLNSIEQSFGDANFWRLRLGIGRPSQKGMESSYVLGNFKETELLILQTLFEKMYVDFSLLINLSTSQFLSKLSGDTNGI